MEKKYWIRINDENKGPYSMQDLVSGNAQANNYVWTKEYDNWLKLNEVAEYQSYLKENKVNIFSLLIKTLLITAISVFILLLIYIFPNLTIYNQNFGGGDGMNILTETAFDNSPTKFKIPTLSFLLLFPIIFTATILYAIVKKKSETRIPIYTSLILLIGIPILLSNYRPLKNENNSSIIFENKNQSSNIYEPQNSEIENIQPIQPINKKYVIVYLKTEDNSGSGYDENGRFEPFMTVEKDNVTGISEYEYFDDTEKAKLEDMVVSNYLNSIDAKVHKGRIVSKKTYVFDTYIEASNKRNEFLIE